MLVRPLKIVRVLFGYGLLTTGILSLMGLTVLGLYNPLAGAQYSLELSDDSWSEDSAELEFLARFPFCVHYTADANGENLRQTNSESQKKYQRPDVMSNPDADYYEFVERTYELDDIRNVQASPNGEYVAVVIDEEMPYTTESLYIIDTKTKKIVFEPKRTQLVRLMYSPKLHAKLYVFEILIWISIGIGFVLTALELRNTCNRQAVFASLIGGLFGAMLLYGCCIFNYGFTWFEFSC